MPQHGECIGFIGLGMMGAGMADCIRRSGFPLIVHDISKERCTQFRADGIEIASSAKDLADRATIVISCLPTIETSREVAYGERGLIEGEAIQIYVETGTVGTAAIRDIAHRLMEQGIATIDGPISGGQAGAQKGTLSTILAGADDAIARFKPVAEAYSSHLFVVADRPGPAQTAKIINNMLSMTGLIAALEGMVLGAKAGLNPEQLLDIINVSTGRNSATLEKIPQRVLPRTFGGHIETGVKDLSLYIEESQQLETPIWMAKEALGVFRQAIENGYDRELLRVIEYMEVLAGGIKVEQR